MNHDTYLVIALEHDDKLEWHFACRDISISLPYQLPHGQGWRLTCRNEFFIISYNKRASLRSTEYKYP